MRGQRIPLVAAKRDVYQRSPWPPCTVLDVSLAGGGVPLPPKSQRSFPVNSCRTRALVLSCLAALLAGTAGCGGSSPGPPRVGVDGEVTFRGDPVGRGSILFIPTGATRGPRVGAVIEAGRFRIPRDRGPVVGELRVEIRADWTLDYDITEPRESVKHIGEPLPRNDIPPEFNDDSTLVITTTAQGDNSFNFHLAAP